MAFFGKLFSGRPSVALVTFDPEDLSLLFTCESTLAPGNYKVEATVAEHKLRCEIKVDSMEAGLHYGSLVAPMDAAEHLAVLLPRPRRQTDQRGAERVERMLRVSSSRLPTYQAISLDLSTSGIKLRVAGPVNPGEELECLLEFDDQTTCRLEVTCQIRWCRPEGDHYLVGASFVDLPKPTHSRLAYFVNALTKVERGVLRGSYEYFD